MVKKRAYYLSLCLLAVPLVAMADNAPLDPQSQVQLALTQLAVQCPVLSSRLDIPGHTLLQNFYQQQDYETVWSVHGRLSLLQAEIRQLADDGLNPSDYSSPDTSANANGVCDDLAISQHYLQALQDLRFGRLLQSRFEPLWRSQEPLVDRDAQVLTLASSGLQDIAGAFRQARPSLDQYQNLRRVYARQRQLALLTWRPISNGPLLRPDMQDARVPELAQRLFSEGYLTSPLMEPDNGYTPELVNAVKSFQLSHSLQADGVIGPGTVKELNISPAMRREQLRVNLERFRWLAQDLEPDSVLVNVAAAQLSVYQNGVPVWQTRTQVGRAERQTPLLKSVITRFTLNPTWTIPPTILREDKLPEIRRDPGFLLKHNLQVLDLEGNPLMAEDIDWSNPGNILLRQEAGPKNPLGRIVIRFPNPYSVYLHDTPSQALFSKGPRAFSSGCVRVEQPLMLRDLLLSPADRARTETLLATGITHEFRLTKPVPILLTYWTAQVDSHGQVLYVPDVYGLDPALVTALAGHP
ncbi:L,D-transpeptidase family protein [Pseudomonas sp. DWP3-1-2]|uniref:L,D-transpeptidase family protein n=1 Tax=Pseudomonas sp. DWP3-1-2 TaxID=2804645 RepID=UPI003CEBDE63